MIAGAEMIAFAVGCDLILIDAAEARLDERWTGEIGCLEIGHTSMKIIFRRI